MPYCLASAAAFGCMGVFGKLFYEQGGNAGSLLALRFLGAALAFWVVLAATGRLRNVRALSRRDLGLAFLLGAVGYGAQAGSYFLALERIDASLLGLVLYTFPVMVTVGAIAIGREDPSRRTGVALPLACCGGGLVVAGAATGALDGPGLLLGFTAAAVYSTYILSSQGIASRLDPLVLATLVCTGAATTLTIAGLGTGSLDLGPITTSGWLDMTGMIVISTVGAISLFFAGLKRVGPSSAAILSTLEPVTTVALAAAVFGEALTPMQLVGALFVISAPVILQARFRPRALAAA